MQIVFRYKRELLTYYNTGVKKFVKAIYSVFIIFVFLSYINNKEKFIRDIPYNVLAFLILSAFALYIYFNTRKFAKDLGYFVHNNKSVKGQIIDVIVDENSKNKLKYFLKVQYINPETKKLDDFITEEVTGNPYRLLKSLNVRVYAKDGKALATDFVLANNYSESIEGKKRKGEFTND